MIETLEKIFGSAARVKIMRLFLLNPDKTFDLADIRRRSKVTSAAARGEIAMMEKVGLVKKKNFSKEFSIGRKNKKKLERRKMPGWSLNESFAYLDPLQRLLIDASPLQSAQMIRRLSRVGKLKLVIVSGIFLQNWDSRVDLLVVGDNLKKGTLENVIKLIESEVGREIRYASFETADFQYRVGVYDKLIRDILDYPHEKILDKMGLLMGKLS